VQVTGQPIPEAVGERRHVTVMFCDLVDSTGIAAELDLEHLTRSSTLLVSPTQNRSVERTNPMLQRQTPSEAAR